MEDHRRPGRVLEDDLLEYIENHGDHEEGDEAKGVGESGVLNAGKGSEEGAEETHGAEQVGEGEGMGGKEGQY